MSIAGARLSQGLQLALTKSQQCEKEFKNAVDQVHRLTGCLERAEQVLLEK